MVHKLAIVAVIGLTASAVCMGAAAAIGGNEFGKGFDGLDLSMFGDRPRCERSAAASPPAAPWTGTAATMSACRSPAMPPIPRAATTRCMSAAIPVLVAHVRVRDGRIELDCHMAAQRCARPGDHPARPGIQEVRHRRQRQPGAAEPQPGTAEAVASPAAATSRPTARWSIPKSISPARATSISAMWNRSVDRSAYRRQRQYRHRAHRRSRHPYRRLRRRQPAHQSQEAGNPYRRLGPHPQHHAGG